MNKYASHAITFALGLLVAAGTCAYFKFRPSLPSLIAQPSKELKNENTETLACRPLAVYPDRLKRTLGLPDAQVKDPSQKIVGSTQVKASEYPHTISAVANIETGKVDMYVRTDRLAWLAYSPRLRLGGFYGMNDAENGVFLGLAQYEIVQIKRVHVSALGQADTSGRYFIGAGLTW